VSHQQSSPAPAGLFSLFELAARRVANVKSTPLGAIPSGARLVPVEQCLGVGAGFDAICRDPDLNNK
jgi:hypothetical protein